MGDSLEIELKKAKEEWEKANEDMENDRELGYLSNMSFVKVIRAQNKLIAYLLMKDKNFAFYGR